MNALLFLLTLLVIFGLMSLTIPYLHLLAMLFAVVCSIFLWMAINKAWVGTRINRLKMSATGSSFYFFLTILFLYWFITIKPSYPGEDTFMRAIGILLAMIVTTVAFITCLIMTGFPKKKERIN